MNGMNDIAGIRMFSNRSKMTVLKVNDIGNVASSDVPVGDKSQLKKKDVDVFDRWNPLIAYEDECEKWFKLADKGPLPVKKDRITVYGEKKPLEVLSLDIEAVRSVTSGNRLKCEGECRKCANGGVTPETEVAEEERYEYSPDADRLEAELDEEEDRWSHAIPIAYGADDEDDVYAEDEESDGDEEEESGNIIEDLEPQPDWGITNLAEILQQVLNTPTIVRANAEYVAHDVKPLSFEEQEVKGDDVIGRVGPEFDNPGGYWVECKCGTVESCTEIDYGANYGEITIDWTQLPQKDNKNFGISRDCSDMQWPDLVSKLERREGFCLPTDGVMSESDAYEMIQSSDFAREVFNGFELFNEKLVVSERVADMIWRTTGLESCFRARSDGGYVSVRTGKFMKRVPSSGWCEWCVDNVAASGKRWRVVQGVVEGGKSFVGDGRIYTLCNDSKKYVHVLNWDLLQLGFSIYDHVKGSGRYTATGTLMISGRGYPAIYEERLGGFFFVSGKRWVYLSKADWRAEEGEMLGFNIWEDNHHNSLLNRTVFIQLYGGGVPYPGIVKYGVGAGACFGLPDEIEHRLWSFVPSYMFAGECFGDRHFRVRVLAFDVSVGWLMHRNSDAPLVKTDSLGLNCEFIATTNAIRVSRSDYSGAFFGKVVWSPSAYLLK